MPKGVGPEIPAQTVPDPSLVPNSVNQDEFKELWIKYCNYHGRNPMTETIPPRDNPKILEFLRNQVKAPSGGFKSGKALMHLGGKRTRKHKKKTKKTKKHRR
jgi:hypothetical protein